MVGHSKFPMLWMNKPVEQVNIIAINGPSVSKPKESKILLLLVYAPSDFAVIYRQAVKDFLPKPVKLLVEGAWDCQAGAS